MSGDSLITMASSQPENSIEWQLHCVLKRASLLQYYDSFIKQGKVFRLQDSFIGLGILLNYIYCAYCYAFTFLHWLEVWGLGLRYQKRCLTPPLFLACAKSGASGLCKSYVIHNFSFLSTICSLAWRPLSLY